MKRITSILTAGSLLLTLTACGSKPQTGATLDIGMTGSYVAEPLPTDGFIWPAYADEGRLWLNEDGKLVIYHTDTGAMQEVALHTTGFSNIFRMPGDRFGLLYQTSQVGADYRPENCTALLDVYDAQMQYLETLPLSTPTDTYVFQSDRVAMDADGWWVYQWSDTFGSTDSHLYVSDPEMTQRREIDTGGNVVSCIMTAPDGSVLAAMFPYRGGELICWRIDPQNAQAERLTVEGMPPYPSVMAAGTGDYALFVSDEDAIYGIRLDGDTGTVERLLDFVNSDFPGGNGLDYFPLMDGRFLLYSYDMDGEEYYLMRPRTAQEIRDLTCLTLAGAGLAYDLKEDVCAFNRTHPDLRILLVDYAATDEYPPYADAVGRFQQDLLAGTVPDIICADRMQIAALDNKGLLADIRPMLEESEDFREEDYLMNFFDAMQYGDRQVRIGFGFTVMTLAGKTEFVGDREGLAPADFMDMLQDRPAQMNIFASGEREDMLMELDYLQGSFVDPEQGTCSFDSPAFVTLLELTGAMQPRDDLSGTVLDEDFWSSWRNDRTLLHPEMITKPYHWHGNSVGYFGNAEVTRVGYPSTDGGNGGLFYTSYTLSVYERSEHKDVIREFFLSQLSEEAQRRLCQDAPYMSDRLPVLRSALEEDMTDALSKGGRTTFVGQDVPTGDAAPEEMQDFYRYLEGITLVYQPDTQVSSIVYEELEMYLAGDQTAQAAAESIQSRVSLYLSELR